MSEVVGNDCSAQKEVERFGNDGVLPEADSKRRPHCKGEDSGRRDLAHGTNDTSYSYEPSLVSLEQDHCTKNFAALIVFPQDVKTRVVKS